MSPGDWFDEDAALVAEIFFDEMLVHVEGPLAGHPFILEPWQREIVREVFGWKRWDGSRKYRRMFLAIPRGNGKSTFAAGLALKLLAIDNEPSAKIYGAAADKPQAAIVFETAAKMVSASRYLSKRIKPFRGKYMEYAETGSQYMVLSSDAYTKHGLNPHGIVFDELHAQPNRELYDVLATAMGKRAQPLMIMITTAGYDRNSICWEEWQYAKRVQDGLVDDPTYFARIWAADAEDDWTSPATWARANPNYGVSVKEEFLRQECEKALQSPAYQNTFKRLYLNIWTQQESRWIDMGAWDKCSQALPDLVGRPCYGGLDLATTTDIAAFVLTFPPAAAGEPLWLLPFFWIPQDAMLERERRDRVPYSTWVRLGLVEATPGNVIDYGYIRRRINELADLYDIKEIAYDPWNATQVVIELEGDGLTMVEMRQGYASLTAPSKELLRLVLSGGIAHGGNAVLRWMADNVTVRSDPAGNIKPDKGNKVSGRIDGIVASIMALGRATVSADEPSVYEERGIRTL